MQKEILTKENIISDLKSVLIRNLKESIIGLPILIFLYLPFFPNTPMSLQLKGFILIFCIIFYGFFTLDYIYLLLCTIVPLCKIKNFTISSDFVINKITKREVRPGALYFPRPYTLVFAVSGKYRISPQKNYKWSNVFAMWDKKVFDHTDLNDDFYVINVGRFKNIVAYNKKMFEYKEISK